MLASTCALISSTFFCVVLLSKAVAACAVVASYSLAAAVAASCSLTPVPLSSCTLACTYSSLDLPPTAALMAVSRFLSSSVLMPSGFLSQSGTRSASPLTKLSQVCLMESMTPCHQVLIESPQPASVSETLKFLTFSNSPSSDSKGAVMALWRALMSTRSGSKMADKSGSLKLSNKPEKSGSLKESKKCEKSGHWKSKSPERSGSVRESKR